ncbi:MAG: hypothetical protein RIR26_1082 [Pseudomonadota bacterium]
MFLRIPLSGISAVLRNIQVSSKTLLPVALLLLSADFTGSAKAEQQPAAVQLDPQATPTPAPTANSGTPPAATTTSSAPIMEASEQREIGREDIFVRFTNQGACIEDIQLKGFKNSLNSEDNAHVTGGHFPCRALALKVNDEDLRNTPSTFSKTGEGSAALSQSNGNLLLTKAFNLSRPYTSDFRLTVKNTGQADWTGTVSIDLGGVSEIKGAGSIFGGHPMEYRDVVYHSDGEVKREKLTFVEHPVKETVFEKRSFVPDWVAANSLYFAFVAVPKTKEALDLKIIRTGFNSAASRSLAPDRTLYEVWLTLTMGVIPSQGEKEIAFELFTGPKSKTALTASSVQNLDRNIDYGFFSVVAWPLYYFLSWCHKIFGNWGIAIIALTVVLKILLYPLTEKAFVAGKKMQKIQPELNALKEKYKDDKQAQQKEMMAIMASKGVNPMSGCLPVLPQLPIFFGLNAVLLHTFELRHAQFAGWLHDLTARDPYYVTPALMAVLMYVQQKLTPAPATMDPAQQKMMQFLPIIFAVFMLTYPSGLVLYIITNTVLSLAQQQYMMKKHKSA